MTRSAIPARWRRVRRIACEERDRHQRERGERSNLDREPGVLVERPGEIRRHEADERDQREEVHGAQRSAERRRRGAEAPDEPDEHDCRDSRGGEAQRRAGGPGESGAVRHEKRALGAVVTRRDRRPVEQGDRERPESDDRENSPDDPFVAGTEPAARVREDQVRERDEREAREQVADREDERAVGQLQRADRPEQPDREHLGAGPVVGPLDGRDRPGDAEDQSGDRHHRDQRPRLAEVGRHDEDRWRRRRAPCRRGRRPRGGCASPQEEANSGARQLGLRDEAACAARRGSGRCSRTPPGSRRAPPAAGRAVSRSRTAKPSMSGSCTSSRTTSGWS